MHYIWGTRMLTGDYSYEFAVAPFAGEWQLADLHRRALVYNFPVASASGPAGDGSLGEAVRLIDAGWDNVLLSALYSENGNVFARLYESQGRAGASPVQIMRGKARTIEVDLLGRGQEEVKGSLAFKAWQFRTFRLDLAPNEPAGASVR